MKLLNRTLSGFPDCFALPVMTASCFVITLFCSGFITCSGLPMKGEVALFKKMKVDYVSEEKISELIFFFSQLALPFVRNRRVAHLGIKKKRVFFVLLSIFATFAA